MGPGILRLSCGHWVVLDWCDVARLLGLFRAVISKWYFFFGFNFFELTMLVHWLFGFFFLRFLIVLLFFWYGRVNNSLSCNVSSSLWVIFLTILRLSRLASNRLSFLCRSALISFLFGGLNSTCPLNEEFAFIVILSCFFLFSSLLSSSFPCSWLLPHITM